MRLIRHQRIKGWRKPERTRSIMRNTIYGNPFDSDRFGAFFAVLFFAMWLRNPNLKPPGMTQNESKRRRRRILDHLDELRQYDNLMCCSDWDGAGAAPPCHGWVYIQLLLGKRNLSSLWWRKAEKNESTIR